MGVFRKNGESCWKKIQEDNVITLFTIVHIFDKYEINKVSHISHMVIHRLVDKTNKLSTKLST